MFKIAHSNYTTLALTLFFFCNGLFAQKPEILDVVTMSENSNVPIANIRRVAQDSKGFIWLGTQDGLFRFDSQNYTTYNTKTNGKHLIGGPDIKDIMPDTLSNVLWVITSYGGLNGIDINTGVCKIAKPQGKGTVFEDELLSKILLCGDSLIITSNKSVFIVKKRTMEVQRLPVGEEIETDNVIKYKNFLVLFSKNSGIFLYNLISKKIEKRISSRSGGMVEEVRFFDNLQLSNTTWLICTSAGVSTLSFSDNDILYIKEEALEKIPAIRKKAIYALCRGKDNMYWFTTGDAVYRATPDFSEILAIKRNKNERENSLKSIFSIYCDNNNNIWLGGIEGVLFCKNKKPPFSVFNQATEKNVSIKHAYYLYPENDSLLYACAETGLYNVGLNTGNISRMGKAEPYDYIFKDPYRRTLVSNNSGLFVKNNADLTAISEIYPEFLPLGIIRINSSAILNDSSLILGTENYKGVLIWNFITHQIIQLSSDSGIPKLKEDVTNQVVKLNNDSIAILSDSYFCIYNRKSSKITTLNLINSDAKRYSIFFDLCKFREYYYLAAYGMGVVVLNDKFEVIHEISTQNGLSNDGVYKLLPWKDSLLFITTNNGLNCYNPISKIIKRFYKSDGLHGNAFEETSGAIYSGTLFGGGSGGITIIHPENISSNTIAPLLYIRNLTIDFGNSVKYDTSDLVSRNFSIPSNALQTNIYFSAINYINPERTSFAYRIKEQSDDWISLGAQNFVTLIGLPPGTYHLQVKAANEDGVWSEPKELILEFLPKWYQTWWFYLLIVLTVAAILYALYRYRIAQIKKQHQIRKNIATDLHDDLGSTLNSVKVFTNLAISGVKQEESLQQIKENLNEATLGLRDMIWVLDDSLDTVDELVTRLKQFAIPVAAASNIEMKIQASYDVNSIKLTKEEKRNLFLICKEAINNSIKYSGATLINVDIKPGGKKIQIAISDNGKGFNAEEVKKGYGLKNMQYRAGQIKFKVALTSSPGKGTQVEIRTAG